MAPGSKFKSTGLILMCEWKECCFVGKCMGEFCNHTMEHLKEHLQHPLGTAGHSCLTFHTDPLAVWETIPCLEGNSDSSLPGEDEKLSLWVLEMGSKSASDLHKHVETHSDSGAHSCDVEGCGFISWTSRTSRQHCKREHVNNSEI
ncbi:LOW QUALITY PROTEIN: uncharacterized protein ACIQIH_003377 [Cyanocitta cristata]